MGPSIFRSNQERFKEQLVKVFVVIVTYNGAKWIDRCVGRTLKESAKPAVIVIDNSSSDNTTELIEKNYPEAQLIKSKENLGFGKANNIGLKMAYDAKADYVLLLNQDAWLEENALEKLIGAQQAQKEFDLLSPMHLNGKGDALDYNFSTYINAIDCKNLFSDIYTGNVQSKIYEASYINAACWLLTKKCIETVGGFSPAFYHYAEDDNYIHRLHYHGLKLGVYPLAKVYHDREPHSGKFHQKEQLQKRLRAIKYSNPNNAIDIDRDIQVNHKLYWRHLLKLNFEKAKEIKETTKELTELSVSIKQPLAISRQRGPSFL
jgi:N-acetylglucosaminyl-diphospho-decaprenol L-rhamnosyltransferase